MSAASFGAMSRSVKILLIAGMALSVTSCRDGASDGPPAAILAAAWDSYRIRDFAHAANRFDEVLRTTQAAASDSPDAQARLQAFYGLASIANYPQRDQDPSRAEGLYRQVIDTAPQSDLAIWSRLAIARVKHLPPVGYEPDLAAAAEGYRRLYEQHPDHLAGQEAFIHLQSIRALTLDRDDASEALAALEGFVQRHPTSGFRSAAHSLMALCHRTLGDKPGWLAAEIRALETREIDPTNPDMDSASAYWRVASIAELEVGDLGIARKYYRLFLDAYPQEMRAWGARLALKRMDEAEARLGRAEGQP
jgi:tetratricopeptide (TPR) repeat protein